MEQEASAGAVAVQFLILIALVVGIGYFIRLRQQLGSRGKESARYPEHVRREILEGRIGGSGMSPEVQAFNERVRQDGGGGKGGISPAVEAFREHQRESGQEAPSMPGRAREGKLALDVLLTRLQVGIKEAISSHGFVMNLGVGGEGDCLIQVLMNVTRHASDSVHCLIDVPFPSRDDQRAFKALGFRPSNEILCCGVWLPRGAERDLALLLVALLTLRGIGPDDIREVDVYEIDKSSGSKLEVPVSVDVDLFELLRLAQSQCGDNQNPGADQITASWNDEEVNLIAEQPWTTFLQAIEIRYMSHRNALMSPGARNQVAPTDRPVAHARQSVIEAYRQNESGSRNDARKTLDHAIVQADSGSIFPDAGEWPIDGVDVGRAHACMWGAIARVFAHKQSSDWASTDATKSDAWFGVATLLFLENRESVMAGRTLEEWGESRRIFGDSESAALLLTCAVPLFRLGGESERAELAGNRIHAVGPVPQASSFLRGEMPSPTERSRLSSVLGASNARSFYESLE
jgi:hypothetical protein